jgi:transcriptional regulator with XRE-family HTH domain
MNIYDIAREAGVSIATVSRVLNHKDTVRADTRAKVEKVLKRCNYAPSAIAQGMVSKSLHTVAVLTVDIRDSHYARTAYTIEREFGRRGYEVILCNTGGDRAETLRTLQAVHAHLGGAVARQLRCNFTDQRCHCQILTDDRIGTAGCNGTDGLFQRGQLAAIDGGVQRHMHSHAPRMAEGDRIFQRIRVKIVGTGAGIETRKTQIHCVGTAEYSGTQHFFVAHRGKDLDL